MGIVPAPDSLIGCLVIHDMSYLQTAAFLVTAGLTWLYPVEGAKLLELCAGTLRTKVRPVMVA